MHRGPFWIRRVTFGTLTTCYPDKYRFPVMQISQAIRCTWSPQYSNEMLQQPLRSFKPYILHTISSSIRRTATRKYPFPMATLSTASTQNEAVSTQDVLTRIVPRPVQVSPFVYFSLGCILWTWHLIDYSRAKLFYNPL